ncbi:condensation domain-containing protein [Nocardia sp. NPDC051832]|uniref:phthiocerol/phthiodiolone dimycocerosyl transferase family protein n=1 Tax=Nocardia sp. NPDC051832 TaxID=3155673 RepID=UPI00341A97B8
MTAQRLVSPFESRYFGVGTLGSVPTGGMPLFIGSTVRGIVDPQLLRRALDELAAAHPLLRSRVRTDGPARFVRDDDFRPQLEISEGGAAEYSKLVNAEQDWRDGLFAAHLLREGARQQVVLVLHHGISDGRSAFALLAELWERYTALHSGSALPQPDSTELPEAVDGRLATIVTDAEVTGWLDRIRAGAATMGPEAAPRTLFRDGDGAGNDPLGRFAMRRIALDPGETAALVAVSRAAGLSVNSVLTGAALIAFRAQLAPAAGALPMFCGHAVDLRPEFRPAVPAGTVVNYASGVGTPVEVAPDADPLEVGRAVAAGMLVATEHREAAVFLLAAQRVDDEFTAALLSAPPTLAISNIGRLPAHTLPRELVFVRDDVYAMGPGMPPKLTVFTVGDRLTIQVEYDTALYSRPQMARISHTLTETVRRACSVTPATGAR